MTRNRLIGCLLRLVSQARRRGVHLQRGQIGAVFYNIRPQFYDTPIWSLLIFFPRRTLNPLSSSLLKKGRGKEFRGSIWQILSQKSPPVFCSLSFFLGIIIILSSPLPSPFSPWPANPRLDSPAAAWAGATQRASTVPESRQDDVCSSVRRSDNHSFFPPPCVQGRRGQRPRCQNRAGRAIGKGSWSQLQHAALVIFARRVFEDAPGHSQFGFSK